MRGLRLRGRELRPQRLGLIVVAVFLEALPVWLRAHRLGGRIVVRCTRGHLFTTIWIPGVSLKSVRLGFWRLEHCPIGHHWTVVTPAATADLTPVERKQAHEHPDVPIP